MHVPMVDDEPVLASRSSRRAPSPPTTRESAGFAVKKTCEAIELGAELGAEVHVMWGGREGVEAEAAKDVRPALDRYKEAIDLVLRAHRHAGAWACASPSNRSRTSPAGDILLPTVGHALAFIGAARVARDGRARTPSSRTRR